MEKGSLNADLFLIDSSSYFYRAFYALPPLSNSKGMPTGASLGYSRMLMKIIKEAGITRGACIFDSRESIRKQTYEAYKANRKAMPEDLLQQVDYLQAISYLLGFQTFKLEGYEADDLIAAIVYALKDSPVSICIVSSDKDLKQLLSDKVFIYDALKNKTVTVHSFEAEYGIKPEEYRYVLALMGDASDNIPGIKGIGEKTALSLINEHRNLDGIYRNIDSISRLKLKELLIRGKQDAYKSLELASFLRDINLSAAYFIPDFKKLNPDFKPISSEKEKPVKDFNSVSSFALKEPDREALYFIFKELEFNSLVKDMGNDISLCNAAAVSKDCEDKGIKPVQENDYPEAGNLLSIYLDQEGKSSDLFGNKVKIFIYSNITGPVSYYSEEILTDKAIIDALNNPSILKIGYGLNEVRFFLEKLGLQLNGIHFDIKIASYLLNPIRHSHKFDEIEEEFKERISVSCGKTDNKNKAYISYVLYKLLKMEIKKDADLEDLFNKVDMPLSLAIASMEKTGFKVDADILISLSASLDSDSKKLSAEIHKIAGREFNINSPKQLATVMFDEMKLRRVKKNSTDIEVLQTLKAEIEALFAASGNEIKENYPLFLNSLISYRNKVKLKTSFVDVLLREIDPGGRVHTSLSQTTTSTGRLASQSPNLQNIPVSGIDGNRIRQSFIAKEGSVLLSADYSQIDLRVMASLSGDKSLTESFKNGEDIHANTAAEIFGVNPGEVDKDMRRKAKVINFGIIYGISPFGLSKELGISTEESRRYIELYFNNHPSIKEYMNSTAMEAKKNGFVRTAFGRKCYIANINSSSKTLSSFAERAAINAPIQGTAADIIKIAMVNIHKIFQKSAVLSEMAEMLLQVHDELIFEVKESYADELGSIVTKIMTEKDLLKNVPLVVNTGIGKNWAEAH